MKKKSIRAGLSMLIIATLIIALAGCATVSNDSATPPPATTNDTGTTTTDNNAGDGTIGDQEITDITVLSLSEMPDFSHLWDTSPVLQTIREETGCTLSFVVADTERANMLLAADDLPDLMCLDTVGMTHNKFVEMGKAVNLDATGIIQEYGRDLLEQFPVMIEHSRRVYSNNTGDLFFLPGAKIGMSVAGQDADYGATLRWDYYQEVGAPELMGTDHLLEVLKQMVDAHPVTEDGLKTYGVSTFNEWGLGWIYFDANVWGTEDGGPTSNSWFERNTQYGEIVCPYTDFERSYLWQTAYFFFKANQLGIFDVDGFTQGWDGYINKFVNGQILYSHTIWAPSAFNTPENVEQGMGYMTVPMRGYSNLETMGFHAQNNISSVSYWEYAVTTSSKHPEKAVAFMNYISSYDGARLLYSGVQGEQWDVIDGEPQMLPHMFDLRTTGGPAWDDLFLGHHWLAGQLCALSGQTIHPADGGMVNLFVSPAALSMGLNNLQKDFSDFYGVSFPMQAFENFFNDGRMWNNTTQRNNAEGITAVLDDDELTLMMARIEGLLGTYLADAVLAKNEAEFFNIRDTAIDQLLAEGAPRIRDALQTSWEASYEIVKGVPFVR